MLDITVMNEEEQAAFIRDFCANADSFKSWYDFRIQFGWWVDD